MAKKKLSPGIHNVTMKVKGGGTKVRKVQVLKNGQWKFLKSSTKSNKTSSKSKGSKKPSNPSSNKKGSGKTTNNHKWTHGKIMKLHALGAAAVDRGLGYMETENEDYIWGLTHDYAGFDVKTGEPRLDHLVRGYVPTLVHKAENKIFQATGIRQPTTDPKTVKAAIKLIVYHGSGVGHAYMAKDNVRRAHQEYVLSEFGVDLSKWRMRDGTFSPMRYIKQKLIPYVLVSKILPHINI